MKLFFREFGKGSPVIILHGLFGLSDNWVTIGRRLGESFRVIIPDLRNHGQSPRSDLFDFPSLSEDIRELMRYLEIGDAMVAGHSLGGKTAALLALESPELVKKLIVVDISLRRYTDHHEHKCLIEAMLSMDIDSVDSRSELEKQLSHSIRSIKIRQFLLKSVYWKNKEHLAWRLNLKAIRENLPQIFESVTPEKQYPGPVLFIKGGLSDYIINEDIPEIQKHFPHAEIQTITDASHWVHADAPEKFYDIVNEFLSSDP